MPTPPSDNKIAPYRNSKFILDPRFPEELEMKKNIYRVFLIILSITLAGCSNAENKNQSVLPQTNKEDVFLDKPKIQSLKTSEPQLKCEQFNLDVEDNMVTLPNLRHLINRIKLPD